MLYQVIWQRLLVLFSGADVFSTTIIVAAFMAGLGIGSLAGGRAADRLAPGASLRAFAIAELMIGLFGAGSKWLYYDVLYQRLPQFGSSAVSATAVLFASLLIPTFLMGVSLPLLARALTDRIDAAGRIIGALYGWNTLGAAAGAFAGTWILVPRFGMEIALWCAAAANLLCAAGAATLITGAFNAREESVSAREAASGRQRDLTLPFAAWAAIYALTGAIALSLEISWFRLIGVMLKSTAFTFGTVLAVYLAGIGAGGAVGARFVDRSRAPGRTFLLLQVALLCYAGLSLAFVINVLAQSSWLARYLGEYEPFHAAQAIEALASGNFNLFFEFVRLYAVIPIVIVGPPTFMMGLSFPFLQRACQTDLPRVGRRVGTLLSANIAGSVAGTVLTGWAFLPWLGTALTLKGLVALAIVLAIPLARAGDAMRAAAAVVTVLAVVAVMPGSDELWARLHATHPNAIIAAEDGSGLSVLKPGRSSRETAVFVNGIGQSWIPYGGIHTVLGALPALIHPSPKTVLLVGLGSGDTVFAAASRPDTETLICVEIIGAQLETLRTHAASQPYPGLMRVLNDHRIRHITGDGRAFLQRAAPMFDVIEMDALRPTSAYAGNLYSLEYFDLLRRRLAPGGLAVSWSPTPRTRDTFISVFPHALVLDDIIVGSNDPIPFDRRVIEERAHAVQGYFAEAGVDIQRFLQPYLSEPPERITPDTRRRRSDLNTDLFPRDEFARR